MGVDDGVLSLYDTWFRDATAIVRRDLQSQAVVMGFPNDREDFHVVEDEPTKVTFDKGL
jgi:hypothetical protein